MHALKTIRFLAGALAACVSVAQAADGGADTELTPLSKMAPEFPDECIGSRLEFHHVVVEYDVTSEGTVDDPVIVESTDECFNDSAIEAVTNFRFEPRRVGGVAVPVTGVRNKFSYTLAAMREEVEAELQSVEERLFSGDGAGALQLLAAFEEEQRNKLNRFEYATLLWMRGLAHSLEKNYAAAGEDLRAALETDDLYPETTEWIRSVLNKVEASAAR